MSKLAHEASRSSNGGYYQRCSTYTGKGGTQRYCFTSGPSRGDRSDGGSAPTMTPEEIAEQARKWEEFCKPRYEVDALGMERAVYAHEGCDTGRSEGEAGGKSRGGAKAASPPASRGRTQQFPYRDPVCRHTINAAVPDHAAEASLGWGLPP